MDHVALRDAVESVLGDEEDARSAGWPDRRRLDWVTEADLVARLRSALVAGGVPSHDLRVNAQGRVCAGGTNFDIEFGYPPTAAIEVVYGYSAGSRVPAAAINGDVAWLLSAPGRHTILFLPGMEPGYSVQNNPRPFDLDGNYFDPPSERVLICEAIQVAKLSPEAHQLLDGIVVEVPCPARGKSRRWSVEPTPRGLATHAGGIQTQVSVVGLRTRHMWAVLWSNSS